MIAPATPIRAAAINPKFSIHAANISGAVSALSVAVTVGPTAVVLLGTTCAEVLVAAI
jgi:hypothetical protein